MLFRTITASRAIAAKANDSAKASRMKDSHQSELLKEAMSAATIEQAIPLFKKMKMNREPIEEYYFWPLIRKQRNQVSVLQIVDIMRTDFDISPPSSDTIRKCIVPKLSAKLSGLDQMIVLLSQLQIKPSIAAPAVVYHCLTQGKIQDALDVANEYKIYYNPNFLKTALINTLLHKKDAGNFAKFLRVLNDSAPRLKKLRVKTVKYDSLVNKEEVVGSVLYDTLCKLDPDQNVLFENVLCHVVQQGLSISKEQRNRIELKLASITGTSDDLIKTLDLLSSGCLKPISLNVVNETLQTPQIIESSGLPNTANETTKSHKIDHTAYVNEALALQKNQTHEACVLLRKIISNDSNLPGFHQHAVIVDILNTVAARGKREAVELLCHTLISEKIMEASDVIFGPLVKVHLVNNDLPLAINAFENICTKHKVTPLKNELTHNLIKCKDGENLQLIVDLSSSVHGEVNSLYDLAFAFIECGHINTAKQILQTPGLPILAQKIDEQCHFYLSRGNTAYLEQLLDFLNESKAIDRTTAYECLMHCYRNDGLFNKIDDLRPKLLKELQLSQEVRGNMEENVMNDDSQRDSLILSKQLLDFKESLRNGKLSDATEAWRNLGDDAKLIFPMASTFINKLLSDNQPIVATEVVRQLLTGNFPIEKRVYISYLNHLRDAADVETLKSIRPFFNLKQRKELSFDNRLCTAYVLNGRAEEYIQKLVDALNCAGTDESLLEVKQAFPQGAHNILENHPELIEKCKWNLLFFQFSILNTFFFSMN